MEAHYRGRAAAAGAATMESTYSSRPVSPEDDEILAVPPRPIRASSTLSNPFSSPYNSRPASSFGSSSAMPSAPQRFFHSRRVKKGEVEQPWRSKIDPREKWVSVIPWIGILVGLGIAGFLVYDGYTSVVQHTYCPVMSEDFSNGLNTSIWTQEAEVGGFGNGEFEMTTTGTENVYIEDGKLIIKPTLQDATLIETNSIINLTATGQCTSDVSTNCVSVTNTTNGTIVPPVKSGRLNTRKGATLKYGRVEVTAKLPRGDWLWPAIWMMPVNSTYGAWPASGEIDIMESRGNNYTYATDGNNVVSSALHWGPDPSDDAWWRTYVKRQVPRTTYADAYNTFGLEWSEKYLFTYINSRLIEVLYVSFRSPLWDKGHFPVSSANGTALSNPWATTGHDNSPFDQEFYLIINVAVGGTNGWFQDGVGGKPWVNESPNAKLDFWNARDEWLPTWQGKGKGQMEISKVQMWQQC